MFSGIKKMYMGFEFVPRQVNDRFDLTVEIEETPNKRTWRIVDRTGVTRFESDNLITKKACIAQMKRLVKFIEENFPDKVF